MRFTLSCLLLCVFVLSGSVIAQDSPEVTETPEPQITLTIWWPDAFARSGEADIHPTLLAQADAFAEQVPNVIFDHRLKAVGQTGGIMSTLRSASNAARSALPSLTLVRRQDLLLAQSNEYIRSLEGFPSSILGDLNNALALGQINETLYGIPYLLETQQIVYRPSEDVDYDEWTFDAVLERGEPITFAAGRVNSLNETLAIQYLSNDNAFVADGQLVLDEVGLASIFDFYERLVADDLLSTDTLNYQSTNSYLNSFATEEINTAVFTSTQYLSLLNDHPDLATAPIPTESGNGASFLNGWMWVLVTDDPVEQEMALEYLNWLFGVERQAEVAQAVGWLPSRERAIISTFGEGNEGEFYLNLFENSYLPLPDSAIGALGREIQTQFVQIVNGEQSAFDALGAVLAAVGE